MANFVLNSSEEKHFSTILEGYESDWQFGLERSMLDITESIAKEMSRIGMTKSQLAEELGTSRSYVTQFFAGLPNLRLSTVYKIGYAVGLRPKVLMPTQRIEPQKNYVLIAGRGTTRINVLPSKTNLVIPSLSRETYEQQA